MYSLKQKTQPERDMRTQAEKFATNHTDVADLITALDDNDIEKDQSWDTCTTTWFFDDDSSISVSAGEVIIGEAT